MTGETSSIKRITLGSKSVGGDQPCLIVAEIGSNHNRDLSTAKRLIDACQQAGVDAVKFQFYTPESIIPRHLPATAYGWDSYPEKYAVDVFKHHVATPADWFPELSDHATASGLMAFAAVHDRQWAELAVSLGFPVLKMASMEITNLDLVETLAGMDKPLIISTGMAHLNDITRALSTARQAGNNDLILLHCVANYPTQVHELNLRQIRTLRECFGVTVGLSDHSLGTLAAVIAVTQGAALIEKHVTLDSRQSGPDHSFALEPDELAVLVRNVRETEVGLGTATLTAIRSDEEKRSSYLRSVVAKRDLKAGQELRLDDLSTKRPGTGIPPRHLGEMAGRRLRRDISTDEPIHWDDLG